MNLTSTVTSKGQITIPRQIRKTAHIKPGDQIFFRTRVVNGEVEVFHTKVKSLSELEGSLPKPKGKKFNPEDLSWV
ncbi:AbrB family transcriptional regulator [Candidatus Shapirobacteria bacterium CG06_land_8_20_14_3_00_40_12]|uniref:AbrB family transcriptional regulator n=1 Tax=Candidatus Shapirobacteria bacterium CG06_land_8_20_14_3_00_40_12 TaxID=1974881 RepID=A0A2M7AR43_9BACT|nr:MAG: AbrB family transcriptional regulator [Candidatus Shapirobacteria bacterium CG06_land_8_20_14_3_00_40_12]